MVAASTPAKTTGPREPFSVMLDMSDAENKRRVMSQIGQLQGWWKIEGEAKRGTRSQQQNRWYWGCIVDPFYRLLRDQDPDIVSPEQAHEALKCKFLAMPVCDPKTGEVLTHAIKSTASLTTEEMADYCERCRVFLAQWFNIVVPDPDPSWRESGRRSPVAEVS